MSSADTKPTASSLLGLILLPAACCLHVASVPALLAADAKPNAPPNVLFILTDQHRQDCVGAYGNPDIHTPNLDRLATEGVRFDRAYTAQPVCSPNRAAIITGLYPHAAGVTENKVPLPASSKTLPEYLAPAGYDCGYFGKWHLHRRDAFETFPEYPGDGRGDNHYFGKGADKRYAVDVITDDAVAFLRRPREGPFYVYVSYYPPHPPFSVPPAYVERYKDITDHDRRIYYAMCTKVDEQIGRLLDALDEIKAAGNTLVIFTTDHGHNFERRWNDHHKRLCYDTSARIPLLMRFPGVIPANRTTKGLISSVDLVPTMLALIRRPVPDHLQGLDASRLARGETDSVRDFVFMENVPFTSKPDQGVERCVRDTRWKLILSTRRSPELYDMNDDPEEETNRWAGMRDSEDVKRLEAALARWADQTQDDLAPRLLAAARP